LAMPVAVEDGSCAVPPCPAEQVTHHDAVRGVQVAKTLQRS
jgi:hypothetical protein